MLGNQSTIEPQAQANLPFKSHCSYWPWGKGDASGEGRGKEVELSCWGSVWRQFWARVEVYSHSLCGAHQSLCRMLEAEPIDLDLMEFGGVTLEVIRVR